MAVKNLKNITVLEFDDEAIKRREAEVQGETDEQIVERLRERFEILTEMTKAVKQGDVRAMIVIRSPGRGQELWCRGSTKQRTTCLTSWVLANHAMRS
jgi:hypothetical protein